LAVYRSFKTEFRERDFYCGDRFMKKEAKLQKDEADIMYSVPFLQLFFILFFK
jgi:hypothetical protein